MSCVTRVFRGVVLPAALAVTASFLISTGPARAAAADPKGGEVCDDGGDAAARQGTSTGYDVKKVEGTGARAAASDCKHAINTKGTGTSGRAASADGGDCDDDGVAESAKNHEVTAPRDHATGQASGRRSCMAINTKGTGAQRKAGPDDDCDGDAADGVQSPRDVATGQASGRRQHCMAIKSKGTGAQRTKADPDEDCDGVDAADGVQSPRDLATGQASGKREAATGQASGKRQHCLAIKTKGTSAK